MVARLDVSGLPRHRLKAVGILVLGVAVSATQDATIKFISTEYPFHEMQFIRSAAALPLILVLTLRRREFGAAIHAGASGLLHLRSFMLALASALFYVGLAAITLADAAAIYFSMPMMLSLLSGPVIGERVPLRRWLAMIVAFIGVVIIIRPGSSVFEPASLIMIAATACYALGHMLTRPLGARVSTFVMGRYCCRSRRAIEVISRHLAMAATTEPGLPPALLRPAAGSFRPRFGTQLTQGI